MYRGNKFAFAFVVAFFWLFVWQKNVFLSSSFFAARYFKYLIQVNKIKT
jgi:hypothetical protein